MSRQAYTDLVEGTYVEPGHDVAPASERACEAVDACFNVTTGNREMLVRLVDSLMRENEELRKNYQIVLEENELLRDSLP